MNLVFFDIECASVNKNMAKICAFGYVVCDESFNIIKKEDILINPKGGFHLTDRKGERGLELPYDYAEFKKHPPFPAVYSFIRGLLEDKDNLVFGHAILNDVKYLDLETRRFKLPPFNFEFLDSQIMYMTHIGDFSRQFGLEYITANLNVEFTPHRAADDAYATMKIVEELCRLHGVSPLALAGELGIGKGRIKGHNIVKPTSVGFEKYVRALGYDFYTICAPIHEGTRELMQVVWNKLQTLPPLTEYAPEPIDPAAFVRDDAPFHIQKLDSGYYLVEADWFPKVLRGVDVQDYESLQYMQRVLEKSGVFDALRRAGCQEGDTVSLYDIEFEFVE